MAKKSEIVPPDQLETLIFEIRGLKVMLDADLARVYGVQTKALNQAVKRNAERFPEDFVFQLSRDEYQDLEQEIDASALRSQTVTSKGRGGRRYLPYVFTEHGAIMAANVLKSARAVQMSVFVVRAFVKMRGMLTDTRELARKLVALEKELKERLDVHEAAIVGILQRVMEVLDPPQAPEPPKKKIGFHAHKR